MSPNIIRFAGTILAAAAMGAIMLYGISSFPFSFAAPEGMSPIQAVTAAITGGINYLLGHIIAAAVAWATIYISSHILAKSLES